MWLRRCDGACEDCGKGCLGKEIEWEVKKDRLSPAGFDPPARLYPMIVSLRALLIGREYSEISGKRSSMSWQYLCSSVDVEFYQPSLFTSNTRQFPGQSDTDLQSLDAACQEDRICL